MSAELEFITSQLSLLNDINDLRNPVIKRVYRLGLTLLIPLLVFCIFYIWRTGIWALLTLPVVVLIVFVTGASPKMSYRFKAWILTILLFGFGVIELMVIGWMSDVRLWMLTSVFIASAFIGKQAGYGLWGLGAITTASYLFLSFAGWIAPLQANIMPVITWKSVIGWFVFAIIGGGFATNIGYWLSNLVNGIRTINAEHKTLQDEKNKIADMVNTLDTRSNSLQQKESIIEAMAAVTASLASLQPFTSFISSTADVIAQAFGFEHVAIYLMDESESRLKLCASSSKAGKKLMIQDFRLDGDDSSIVGWVATNHKRKCHTFENGDVTLDRHPNVTSLHAELAMPIMVSGAILGVLDIQSSNPVIFDDFTVSTLERLVSEFTYVYTSSRSLDGMPVLDTIQPFYRAVQYIASCKTDNAVYAAVLELLHTSKPCRLTFFRVEDGADGFYTIFDSINGQSAFVTQPLNYLDSGLLNIIAESATRLTEPLWLEKDKLHNAYLPENLDAKVFTDFPIQSLVILPILIQDRFAGAVISLFEAPHQFSQIEKLFHRVVAIMTAQVLDRIELINDATRRQEHERILNGIRTDFSVTLDPDVILRKTAQELGRLLGAEETFVHVAAAENLETSPG